METTVSTERPKPAIVALEDGTVYEGIAVGAEGVSVGEIVFNTSMSGYQEILTDPSYAGQIVTLTSPHIGNYGVTHLDRESSGVKAAGLVVRSMSEFPSNQRAEASLPEWLTEHGVVAISEVDTRALTRHIRDKGVMMAAVVHGATVADAPKWRSYIEEQPGYGETDFVARVRCESAVTVRCVEEDDSIDIEFLPLAEPQSGVPHVVVIDFGVKHSILRNLCRRGLALTLVPSTTSLDAIRSLEPDGVLISNGPGDPARLNECLDAIRGLTQEFPTFGICLGHQLLARSFGADTFKLPFGHRGPNQPVQDVATGKIEMTSQNHGYAVDVDHLPDELEVTHINLNDDTVEGFRHRELPVFAVQYHPEAGPGPHDAETFFDRFAAVLRDINEEVSA